MKNYLVYMHRNKINNMVYIGKTCQDIHKRWGAEGKNYYHNVKFYSDIVKYGWGNFEHKVLETALSNYEAKERENYYIQKYNSIIEGYNTTLNDLTNKNEKGPGRPTKDRRDKLVMGFEGTIPLKSRLEEEAQKRYMSVSALIREILEKHFEER